MAYHSSKGYYVQQLKSIGVTRYNGYRLETYKGAFLAYLWHKVYADGATL